MNFTKFSCLVLLLVCWVPDTKAEYRCGFRKHSFIELINRAWKVEEGQWPWHVGLFNKTENEYLCGGTLIDDRHIVTAAHCVAVVYPNQSFVPTPAESFSLYFGLTNRLNMNKTEHVRVRDVARIHVYPEYQKNLKDIAVLEFKPPVEFTDLIIPICLDTQAHRDLRDMEGQRGYIAGWGRTENGTLSEELRSASMPVVNLTQCLEDDRMFFGNILNSNVFCAGDRNGTSPGQGDSGGGMYFREGNRWVLRGIVSFARYQGVELGIDTSKFVVFTNVQRFLTWIREVTDDRSLNSTTGSGTKRISEIECDRFKSFVDKHRDGSCKSNAHTHIVSVESDEGKHVCNGILLNEYYVLTTCLCISAYHVKIIRFGEHSTVNISSATCSPEDKDSNATYNQFKQAFDAIAVIKLEPPVELSRNLIPACLASNFTENLYDTLLISGRTKSSLAEFEESLGILDHQISVSQQCKKPLREGLNPDLQLCIIVNDHDLGKIDLTRGTHLLSINSRTCLCTVVGVFRRYAKDSKFFFYRVMKYLSWIEETVWGVPVVSDTMSSSASEESNVAKRISEKECDRFKSFARKSSDGSCLNTWQSHKVTLLNNNKKCIGYLINENHVLTTCSCAQNKPQIVEIVGNTKLYAANFSCSPAYNDNPNNHNIAIVRLASAVHLSYQTIPVCLARNWTENLNETLTITSFGDECNNMDINNININQVLTPEECNRDDRKTFENNTLHSTTFCLLVNWTWFFGFNFFDFSAQTVNNQTCLFAVVGVLGDTHREKYLEDELLLPFIGVAPYLDWIEEIVWGVKAAPQTTAMTSSEERTTTEQSSTTHPIGTERLEG